MSQVVRVAVTGAAGRVSSSLIVRLASGEVFGPETKVILQLLELPPSINPVAMKNLEGAMYELQDCGFSTLQDVIITDDPNKAFAGCNWALLVGAAPRGPGEQRADLIRKNGPIFVGQGQALARHAAADVRILVVGNPCNTNCLIAYRNGKDIPAERWHAMTRLDHNRAVSALARKAGVQNETVTCMTIWGNHSNTQFPDFTNARIGGKPAASVITDRAWLENTFVPECQERGKFIIDTTKVSSSFSAANGAIDHVKTLVRGTPANDWTSAAIVSSGQYGVPAGMVFGYPCTTGGDGKWLVVEGLKLDAFGKSKFDHTLAELQKEMDVVKDLLPS
jgi:malate dehydrogenase